MKTVDAFRILFARLCVNEAADSPRLVDRLYLSDTASQALKDAGMSLGSRHETLKAFRQCRYGRRAPERKKVA